jgi:Flp pilus assembly protein CpaB
MRAVSVRVDEASSVAGFALAGNYVDVIVIMQPQTNDARPVSKVILQNIRVLATGQQMQARNDGKATLANTVTLLVTPGQAEKLKLAESEGKLQLSVRNSTDTIAERTPGATRRDVLNDADLERRALIGVRRSDPAPARPAPVIPPLVLQTAANNAKPTPTPAPTPRVFGIELIEGSKRSRIEVR